jgi:acetyltransferase-like isoleucine patch superfamily enzyme
MNKKNYFVHPNALVKSEQIGDDTRVWAFANVQETARIGSGCNICDHCFVENNVVIGNDVTVKNGVSLWDGLTIEDRVFIGPNAVFTNDIYPRSKVYHSEFVKTLIREGATIGANATVIAGHTVGRYAFIGAGSVVTKEVPDFTMWVGNPARLVGYVCKCAQRINFPDSGKGPRPALASCKCGLVYQLANGIVTPA